MDRIYRIQIIFLISFSEFYDEPIQEHTQRSKVIFIQAPKSQPKALHLKTQAH